MKWKPGFFSGIALCVFLLFGSPVLGDTITINFDDVTGHLTDITNYYSGVTFNGIPNPFPIGPGPFPAPSTLPTILGGAATWDPEGKTAPGESPPNFAVGLGGTLPGHAGILITFDHLISSLSLTGLDFGNSETDTEQMTLTAYDIHGDQIGQEHFVDQFAVGAIRGTIDFDDMKYVAFNYTNTQYGFYGIDDLSYTPVPEPSTMIMLGCSLVGLVGYGRKRLKK